MVNIVNLLFNKRLVKVYLDFNEILDLHLASLLEKGSKVAADI